MLRFGKVGCFLVRVSENRFGYTLSYRTKDRCKHFMVEQDARGRYALVGMDKIATSLNALINWYVVPAPPPPPPKTNATP